MSVRTGFYSLKRFEQTPDQIRRIEHLERLERFEQAALVYERFGFKRFELSAAIERLERFERAVLVNVL